MDDIRVPLFYVLNRLLPREEAWVVLSALKITPCRAAIVSDLTDAALAWSFVAEVIRSESDAAALLLAKRLATECGSAILVLGVADFLDAVYPDGVREAVAKTC